MLVLLVFGLLIMLIDHLPEFHFSAKDAPQSWLEIQSDHPILLRFEAINDIQKLRNRPIPGFDINESMIRQSSSEKIFKNNNMLSLERSHDGQFKQTRTSPRLMFILKQHLPVNEAGREDLELVPGIGPYLANNINRYHLQRGKINNISELMLVPGIGKLRAEKLAPYLSFE